MTRASPGPVQTFLRPAVAVTSLAGAGCVVVAAVRLGPDGLLAALVGLGGVLGFLLVGQLPVAAVASGRRGLGAGALVLLYSVRVTLLVLALQVLFRGSRPERVALGATVVVCALAWTAGTVVAALRWHPVLVVPEPPSDPSPGAAAGSEMPEPRW